MKFSLKIQFLHEILNLRKIIISTAHGLKFKVHVPLEIYLEVQSWQIRSAKTQNEKKMASHIVKKIKISSMTTHQIQV